MALTNGRGQGPEQIQPDVYPVDELATACPLCGIYAVNQHYSCAAGAVCCERCHGKAAPPASREARAWRPSPPPEPAPPPKPGSYAWFVRSVRQSLEDVTQMPVFLIERGKLAGYCPVGCGGTLAIKFLDTSDGPEVIVTSNRGADVGRCSMGCKADAIMAALG